MSNHWTVKKVKYVSNHWTLEGITMGKCYNQLTLNDRLIIEKMLKTNKFTKQEIADIVGCSRNTIYREIRKGTIQGLDTNLKEIYFYCGDTSHRITVSNKKKQGSKLKAINDRELMAFITKKIEVDKYSPRAVVKYIEKHKLKFKYYISDFTIYRYVKKGYFENLTMANLPYEKIYKKKYQKMQKRATFGESIEKRPIEVLSRKEFGHWEMDSVEGSRENSKKSLLVLSERKTRKELIFINENMTSYQVVDKINILEKSLGKYFNKVFRSITMDNGTEFADVIGISKSILNKSVQSLDTPYKIRVKLYYCHPSTPQERGTNENINKMIRKYIPKGTNFDNESIEKIKYIQEEINNYPRKIFDYNTSNDMFIKELNALKIPKKRCTFLFH